MNLRKDELVFIYQHLVKPDVTYAGDGPERWSVAVLNAGIIARIQEIKEEDNPYITSVTFESDAVDDQGGMSEVYGRESYYPEEW
jgi:hypothetical protein